MRKTLALTAMTRHESYKTLCPADAQALDALLTAHSLTPLGLEERSENLAVILALLDRLPIGEVPADLVDRVMAAVARQAQASKTTDRLPTLCEEDQSVLDAVFAAGNASGPMPAGSSDRGVAVRQVLSLLDAWTIAPAPANLAPANLAPVNLVDATLGRIDQSHRRLLLAVSETANQTNTAGSIWPMAIRRLGAVAAVGTLAVSILLPMLSKAQRDAQITTCRDNLAQTGQGLASYAHDNGDRLPQQSTPVFDRLLHFSEIASDDAAIPSSSVYLFLLPSEGYLDEANLACPSAEDEVFGGMYSTQNTLGRTIKLSLADGPLMADTNPLYAFSDTLLIRDDSLSPWTSSKNHGTSGQNVMMADGSVRWLIRPAIQGGAAGEVDNLWSRDEESTGSPRDADHHDAFLTQ